MKVLAIGDPHGDLKKLKEISYADVDLILLTGDIGKADLARKQFFENIKRKKEGMAELSPSKQQVRAMHLEIHDSTIQILKYLSKYAPVYAIQGNVGIPSTGDIREDKEKYGISLPNTSRMISSLDEVYVVKNRLRIINDLRVGFLDNFLDVSWVKEFKPRDYSKQMKKAKLQTGVATRVLKRFSDLDILVCHQPPYGVLDKVNFPGAPKDWQGKHAGSRAILDYIRKYSPRYVFCGHIHEGQGYRKIGKTEVYNLGVAGHKIVEM